MRKILIRKALLDITRRKGRSILIILGVVISVFGFTTVSEAANLTRKAIICLLAWVFGILTQQGSDQGMQRIKAWDQATLDDHVTGWFLYD